LRFSAALKAIDGKRMHIKLGDLVTAAHQAHELLLGDREGRIGHHVEEAYVELSDVLVDSVIQGQDFLPLLAEVFESGKRAVGH
jgi:hypothetical protein